MGSLVGCRLWGCIELDTTEATQQQQQAIPDGPVVRNPPANAGDTDLIPAPEDSMCSGATKPMCPNY